MLAPFYQRRPADRRSLRSVLRFIAPDLLVGGATFALAYGTLTMLGGVG